MHDPTDFYSESAGLEVTTFLWLPRSEVLSARQLEPYTPVAAICSASPSEAADIFYHLLEPQQRGALILPPRKLRNEEKEYLLIAAARALRECFVLAVTIPDIFLGAERPQPETAYRAMINLFFSPLLTMHKRLGVERFHARFANVGPKDNLLVQLAKKSVKACYPKKLSASVDFAGTEQHGDTFTNMARLLAWAVSHYYNHGDSKWIDLFEKNIYNE
jgi:hypothetical protein